MFGRKSKLIKELQEANQKLVHQVQGGEDRRARDARDASAAIGKLRAELKVHENWRAAKEKQLDLEAKRTALVLQLVVGRGMSADEARDEARSVYPEAK